MNVISAHAKGRLLNLVCLLVGTMMTYRGVINLFQYPDHLERTLLGPIFLGGTLGIFLIFRRYRIGFWLFTVLNFLVGYWFIFVLEDVWTHHVLPHIVFSAVFVPFYGDLRSLGLIDKLVSLVGSRARRLLNYQSIVNLIERIPALRRWANLKVIDVLVGTVRTRPHPYSTIHDYVSWRGLTDRTWSARHLGPSAANQSCLPCADALVDLFRQSCSQRTCPKSTCLFPAFAQYLTDGFIRTKTDNDHCTDPDEQAPDDHLKRTTSNHNIDLSSLYGLNPVQTRQLRVQDQAPDDRGKLKSQWINGEEYSPFLFKDCEPDPQFNKLDKPLRLARVLEACECANPNVQAVAITNRDSLFAVGGDRVNAVPQSAMINTLLLREHNRLACELGTHYTDWSDDRVFETARNIVIVEFIKIVVEDYINHISPIAFDIKTDPTGAWLAPWNKPNWITTEFSLLYRWHALVPDKITWGEKTYLVEDTFLNNNPLLCVGLAQGFIDMSRQPAGELGPMNTTEQLLDVEKKSIVQGRICNLQPFVAYKRYLGQEVPGKMSDISSCPKVISLLKKHYKGVEDVDFFVGLFTEDREPNSPLPPTVLTLVAVDAFSQALTNPLLSEHVFNQETFSSYGWGQIQGVSSLADLVHRNVAQIDGLHEIGMTRACWVRE